MFNWFKRKTTKEKIVLPAKDPNDFTLTKSSTQWGYDHHCSACLSSIGHREFMADVCNSCGSFGTRQYFGRSFRQIWDGEKWIWQYRYKENNQLVLSEKKLHCWDDARI